MIRQPDLFAPWADVTAHQEALFDLDGPADSYLSCAQCGSAMTRTPSGYLACPRGHGRLIAEGRMDVSPLFDEKE